MNKLIETITEFLVGDRQLCMTGTEGDDFELMGCSFKVIEYEFHSPMSAETLHRIMIIPSRWTVSDLSLNISNQLSLSEVYSNFGQKGTSTEQIERLKVCRRLAINLVREVLPKMSQRARIELNNIEVENILDVLD